MSTQQKWDGRLQLRPTSVAAVGAIQDSFNYIFAPIIFAIKTIELNEQFAILQHTVMLGI